nr:choice-of-anchor A family protein [uncultured Cellulosilyticum sp.]
MSHSLKVKTAKVLMLAMMGTCISTTIWAEETPVNVVQEAGSVDGGAAEEDSNTVGAVEVSEATEKVEGVEENVQAPELGEEIVADENSEKAAKETDNEECLSSEIIEDDTTGLSEKLAKIKNTLPMNRPLWIAGNFNFFIFDTHEMTNGDSEGRVAVGKKAIYNQYAIAQTITTEENQYPVAVVLGNGGSFSLTSGQVSGNIITDSKDNVTLQYAGAGAIDEMNVNNDIIDFAALQKKYIVLSYFLALKVPTGTVQYNQYNKNCLELKASDDADKMVVFTLPPDVTSLGEIQISNIDMEKQPTIVINSMGNAIGQTAQMMINGSSELAKSYAGRIIWNLPLAMPGHDIPIAGTIYGSVLAPTGDFRVAGYGNIEGTFIANSFVSKGNFEGHNNPFIGKLPPITCPNLEELEYWMNLQP